MRKTTIYLDDELDVQLDHLSRLRGVSKAELIRAAVRRLIGDEERPRVRAIGVASGPGDVAGDVDRHLRETGFGE